MPPSFPTLSGPQRRSKSSAWSASEACTRCLVDHLNQLFEESLGKGVTDLNSLGVETISFVILVPGLRLFGGRGRLGGLGVVSNALPAAPDSTRTGGGPGGIVSYCGPAMKEEVYVRRS